MSQRRTLIALCAVALSAVLLLPDVSSAQFHGFGGRMGGIGNYGGWGNYGGMNYGGWGNYGGMNYGGWGYPSNYGTWGGTPYYGTWGNNSFVPSYTYTNPQPYNYSSPRFYGTFAPGQMGVSSQSLYPPDGQSQFGHDNTRAYIDVRVPPDAQVFFDNSPTQQQGPDRRFMTPQLEPNSHYTYKVSAKWMENGKERRESRTVRLTPGQVSHVNFLAPHDGQEHDNNANGTQQQRQPTRTQPPQQQQPRQTQTPPTTSTSPDR